MGTTNFGNQTVSFDYKTPGKSETFNKLNYEILPVGMYQGGVLTRTDTTTVQLSQFTMFIEDSINKLGIRISTASTIDMTVNVLTPYIIARYSWSNVENNYADIIVIAYEDILADDLIIGRCVYNTLNELEATFDYTRRTVSSLQYDDDKKDNLKVLAQEPIDDTVHVNSGQLVVDGTYIDFSEGNSASISATTDGRIDLVYINEAGAISILEGVDAVAPVMPDFPIASITLAYITRGATDTVVRGDQITLLDVDKEMFANDSSLVATIDGHKAENITSADTVHGIQQGAGNGFDADKLDGADLSTDGTLIDNSDSKIPSQQAVKTYADGKYTEGTDLSLYDQATDQDRNIEFASDASLLWDETNDWFQMNKPLSGTKLFKELIAGSTIISSNNTELVQSGTTYVTKRTLTVTSNGTITVSFALRSVSGSYLAYCRILKNAVTQHEVSNLASYVTYNLNVTVEVGDVIIWQVKNEVTTDTYIKDISIKVGQDDSTTGAIGVIV